ncbi:MAG: hypothetical protein P8Y71_19510, partial [Pseudolabrys sp.]
MTGSCHRPTGVCAHARARPPVRGGGARLLPALLLVVAVLTGAPARADMLPGRVSTATDHGFARMVFKFDQPVPARVSL